MILPSRLVGVCWLKVRKCHPLLPSRRLTANCLHTYSWRLFLNRAVRWISCSGNSCSVSKPTCEAGSRIQGVAKKHRQLLKDRKDAFVFVSIRKAGNTTCSTARTCSVFMSAEAGFIFSSLKSLLLKIGPWGFDLDFSNQNNEAHLHFPGGDFGK